MQHNGACVMNPQCPAAARGFKVHVAGACDPAVRGMGACACACAWYGVGCVVCIVPHDLQWCGRLWPGAFGVGTTSPRSSAGLGFANMPAIELLTA
jgi:hypothetical protein